MTKIQEIDKWLWNQCRDAAQEWFMKQRLDACVALYLWFKRGNLTVASDKPIGSGFELASPNRINPGWTAEQVKFWIYGIARLLPCLPDELTD